MYNFYHSARHINLIYITFVLHLLCYIFSELLYERIGMSIYFLFLLWNTRKIFWNKKYWMELMICFLCLEIQLLDFGFRPIFQYFFNEKSCYFKIFWNMNIKSCFLSNILFARNWMVQEFLWFVNHIFSVVLNKIFNTKSITFGT